MTIEPRVHQAFVDAAAALASSGIDHALVGALARAVWARPRASTDVDFAVAYDPERLPLTRARFERTMELRAASEKDELPELSVWRSPSGVRVDFLVTHTPFEQEAHPALGGGLGCRGAARAAARRGRHGSMRPSTASATSVSSVSVGGGSWGAV